MFNHHAFRDELGLSGVNSINWARIVAQVVYYFTAAVSLGAPHRPVSFSVPTGNFGDVLAGWVAKRMGLPIGRLERGDEHQRHPGRAPSRPDATRSPASCRRPRPPWTSRCRRTSSGCCSRPWPGRRGRSAADGVAVAEQGLHHRRTARWRRSAARVQRQRGAGGCASPPRWPPHGVMPAICSTRTPRSAWPARAEVLSARPLRAGCGAGHRPSRQVPRRGRRLRPACSRRFPRISRTFYEREERFTVLPNDQVAIERFVRSHATRPPGGSVPHERVPLTMPVARDMPSLAPRRCRSRRCPNGLRVVTEAMPQLATAALGVWIGGGHPPREGGRAGSRASARAHGLQGHASGARRSRSSRRSRRSAATSTPRPAWSAPRTTPACSARTCRWRWTSSPTSSPSPPSTRAS